MTEYDSSQLGGFWIRVLARLIDNILVAVFVFVLYLLFFGLDSGSTFGEVAISQFFIIFIIISIVSISYMVALAYSGIILLYFWIVGSAAMSSFGGANQFVAKILLFLIFSLVVYVLYHVLFNLKGATPGKLATGLEIRDEETLDYLPFGKVFGRFLALEFISGIAFGLGFLWAGWDRNKQTWHDKLARTVVVYKDLISREEDHVNAPTLSRPKPRLAEPFGELVFVSGRMSGKHFSLRGNKVVIGRGSRADVRIDDPDKRISREQVAIFKNGSRYFIRNLSTSHSTTLNSRRLDEDLPLRENDEIGVFDYKMKVKFFN